MTSERNIGSKKAEDVRNQTVRTLAEDELNGLRLYGFVGAFVVLTLSFYLLGIIGAWENNNIWTSTKVSGEDRALSFGAVAIFLSLLSSTIGSFCSWAFYKRIQKYRDNFKKLMEEDAAVSDTFTIEIYFRFRVYTFIGAGAMAFLMFMSFASLTTMAAFQP